MTATPCWPPPSQTALDIAEGRAPRLSSLQRTDRLPAFGEAAAVFEFARAEAGRRARGLAHPLLCLEAIEHGVAHGGAAGLKKVGGWWELWGSWRRGCAKPAEGGAGAWRCVGRAGKRRRALTRIT